MEGDVKASKTRVVGCLVRVQKVRVAASSLYIAVTLDMKPL